MPNPARASVSAPRAWQRSRREAGDAGRLRRGTEAKRVRHQTASYETLACRRARLCRPVAAAAGMRAPAPGRTQPRTFLRCEDPAEERPEAESTARPLGVDFDDAFKNGCARAGLRAEARGVLLAATSSGSAVSVPIEVPTLRRVRREQAHPRPVALRGRRTPTCSGAIVRSQGPSLSRVPCLGEAPGGTTSRSIISVSFSSGEAHLQRGREPGRRVGVSEANRSHYLSSAIRRPMRVSAVTASHGAGDRVAGLRDQLFRKSAQQPCLSSRRSRPL